jgi:hypothetical protein
MSEPTINVRKIGWTTYVSTEQLWFNGAITDEQAREMGYEPPAPPTRWTRWKWAARSWWWDHRPTLHLGPCDHGDCG